MTIASASASPTHAMQRFAIPVFWVNQGLLPLSFFRGTLFLLAQHGGENEIVLFPWFIELESMEVVTGKTQLVGQGSSKGWDVIITQMLHGHCFFCLHLA